VRQFPAIHERVVGGGADGEDACYVAHREQGEGRGYRV
jgi:hypothetical protein